MQLTDLAPASAWAELEQEVHERFNLNASVVNTEGARITDYANWGNELCPKVKGNPQSAGAICAVVSQSFLKELAETRQPVIRECDAGLLKIGVPVFAGDELVGCAGGCGVLPPDGEVETFLVSKATGMGEEEVEKLAATAPVMSREKARDVAEFVAGRLREMLKS